ncbi:hypothetical protein ACLMAL_38730 [Nocardia sp. CWNU-33]|uniref:hypothetical protein n=1 Tax=Nocardia sp. CWNU-33 TaxID=3392117 RepID=UPI00398F823F
MTKRTVSQGERIYNDVSIEVQSGFAGTAVTMVTGSHAAGAATRAKVKKAMKKVADEEYNMSEEEFSDHCMRGPSPFGV